MKILLTNDDGIHSTGICALSEILSISHDVYIVAPDSEKSAVGHAITLSDPLKVREVKKDGKFFGWAVNGTPADCVKLALTEIIKDNIDIVISGINRGANLGINVLYSGTVSAATEAAMMGYKSIAVSFDSFHENNYCYPAYVTSIIAEKITKLNFKGISFNVNFPNVPPNKIKGIKFVKLDISPHQQRFKKNIDPRGNIYYWQESEIVDNIKDDSYDIQALKKGFITITPIKFDLTCYETLNKIINSNFNIEI